MIKTQAISTEAASATHQGLTSHGKKGKGKHQSLFSKLLASLEHKAKRNPKSGQQTTPTDKKLNIVKNTQTKESAAKTIKNMVAATEKDTLKLDAKVEPHKEGSKEALVTTHQEVALIKVETNKGFAETSTQPSEPSKTVKNKAVKEISIQPPLHQSEGKNSNRIDLQNKTNNDKEKNLAFTTTASLAYQESVDKGAQLTLEPTKLASTATATPISTSTLSINAQVNFNQKKIAIGPQKSTQPSENKGFGIVDSLLENKTVTKQTIIQEKITSQPKNQQPIDPESGALQQLQSDTRVKQSQQNIAPTHNIKNVKKEGGEHEIPPQTQATAGLLQRHAQQPLDATTNSATPTSATIKTLETNHTSSQQDMASNQQDSNPMMLDMSKAEQKSKGVDFQAQMAYKSQQTYTAHDAMLEIVKSAKDGSTALELQLEPAHLGKVQVSIQMDTSKQLQVMFTVDQQTSRQALEQQMPQLKLALAQQGLDLGSFSMQMNQQHSQQGHESSGQQTMHNHGDMEFADAQEFISQNKIGVNIATDGRLSILA